VPPSVFGKVLNHKEKVADREELPEKYRAWKSDAGGRKVLAKKENQPNAGERKVLTIPCRGEGESPIRKGMQFREVPGRPGRISLAEETAPAP